MEIAGLVVAVFAVVVAGASALYAKGANARADTANERATEALDLQKLIDARDREFRDVRWKGGYDAGSGQQMVFRLTNVGHTPACEVSLLFAAPGKTETLYSLGPIEPGGSADVVVGEGPHDRALVELKRLTDAPWRVHWSSPLGQAREYEHPGRQIF